MADKIFSIADGLHDELPSITTAVAGRMLITTDTGEMYYEPEDRKRVKINNVDQTYTPDSENAQSGKAVAEAVAIEQNRADTTFANALKGTASGSAILIDDVSPVTHEMRVNLTSKNITDLKVVKVKKYGTNLIDGLLRSNSSIASGINIQYLPDEDCYLLNGTCTDTVDAYIISHNFLINDYITTTIINVSGSVALNGGYAVFYSGYKDSVDGTTYNWSGPDISYSHSATSSSPRLYLSTTKFYITKGVVFEDYKVKIQVAKGKNAAEYEPFIASNEYTPTADGTVEGVTSLYPNTTLMTDTDGVIIDCEYNRDINKFSGIDVDVPTKTSELINDSNFATQDYVDEEIANFDFIKIVTVLPETGLVNRTYFVPKEDPNTNDLYDEYMWVDNKWELITTKQIEVDLTEYVKNTDINQSYDPLSENAQSGKAVSEAVSTEQKRADNTFANALKGTKSDTAILLDDVSPVTHDMSVKVRSKNILPYPYAETTKTLNGITITDNGDGSINLNGTSTAQVNFYFSQNLQLKKGITYTLSASGNYSFGGTASFYIYHSTYGSLAYINLNADNSYTFTPTKDINGINCYIVIPSDRTVSGTLKPQLELGSTSTAYTPYVPDLTAVKVSRCGKNLLSNDTVISESATVVNKKIWSGNLPTPCTFSQDISQFTVTNPSAAIFMFKLADGTEKYLSAFGNRFLLNDGTLKEIYFINWATGTGTVKCQLEIGSTETPYEPYQGQTYTPTADGTVSGVKSLYPNTTLTTDTDGVIIDCEYNRDINKFSGIDVDVPTKTSELINDSNFATQDYVDEEIANFDFIKIVTVLPETGLVNRTYFVPKEDPNTNDLYDEYMWVDNKWELITTKQIEVDLTEYVKNTDINQSYDPLSENAQSGKAVSEAVIEAKDYTDTKIGDIDTALDSIIALQNSYIGGNA